MTSSADTKRYHLLLAEYKKILTVLKATQEFDKSKESHPGAWWLWINDTVAEEVLIIEELRMEMKEIVQKMFEEARGRAIVRPTDYLTLSVEASRGLQDGLTVAYELVPITTAMMNRIQTESSYGFAFMCGLLCKVEAVKGKHYAAIWQKRGEPGILDNLLRKANRAEQIVELQKVAPERPFSADDGETLSETLGDGAVYALKWLTWRKEFNPQEFLDFVQKVHKLGKPFEKSA